MDKTSADQRDVTATARALWAELAEFLGPWCRKARAEKRRLYRLARTAEPVVGPEAVALPDIIKTVETFVGCDLDHGGLDDDPEVVLAYARKHARMSRASIMRQIRKDAEKELARVRCL